MYVDKKGRERLTDNEMASLIREHKLLENEMKRLDARISWELNIRFADREETPGVTKVRSEVKSGFRAKKRWEIQLDL